ncbi:hypothetical protein [Geminicoccus flavidas]|nr:hypothetical protein [Geminicoccus flavidas]
MSGHGQILMLEAKRHAILLRQAGLTKCGQRVRVLIVCYDLRAVA